MPIVTNNTQRTKERELYLMAAMPEWEVQKLTVLGKPQLGITCPRKDCNGRAIVNPKWAKPKLTTYNADTGETVKIVGRSCTYCMKVALVPSRFTGGKR